MAKTLQIGSTVRITQSNDQKAQTISRRAIIATLSNDSQADTDEMCALILEDLAPTPLVGNFLVTPLLNGDETEERELEIAMSDVLPLLPFEHEEMKEETIQGTAIIDKVESYKEYGDQLFRLHDYSNAISYYEAALGLISSNFSNVGGTLVVKKEGHCVIAELDCIDAADTSNIQYDVTYILPDGETEENIISSKDILFAVWDQDGWQRRGKRDKAKEKFLQPRILLNLCRCLLRLAEVDAPTNSSNKDRAVKYRKAAVLGCSIGITLCEYYIHNNSGPSSSSSSIEALTSLLEKARLLRSRSFFELGKLPNATNDVKKVINHNPTNREAAELLKDIRTAEQKKKKADKRLSKEICRWVQSATRGNEGI